jgi:YD repeat-containing protein
MLMPRSVITLKNSFVPAAVRNPFGHFAVLLLVAATVSSVSSAATTGYEYDALGRLNKVTHANGNVTTYKLDAAGNRTEVEELAGQAAPASISVPATSLTGSYTVSWTAGGTVATYELWESTSSTFTTQQRVFIGPGTSASISGHGNGNWYYRVRGCNGSACTTFRTGANGIVVTVPPGAPASLSVPGPSTTGSFTIGWGGASGTMTAYQLTESTSSSFSGEGLVHSGTGSSKALSGRGNGTWYYRVRACNGLACSGYAPGGNSIVVTLPPGTPASLSVPATDHSGSYAVSWGAATGNVTAYRLEEANNSGFLNAGLAHNAVGTSTTLTGRGNGTYYYRVRACNGAICGSYSGTNSVIVTITPGAPPSLTVPSTSSTGGYNISWTAASGTVSAYQLYEANNSGFSGETQVYNNVGTSTNLLGRLNGTYYYRVRACYNGACSGYTGSNPLTVTLTAPAPPGTPRTYTQNSQCSWTANWPASDGATSYTVRDWSGNFQPSFPAPPVGSSPSGIYNFCGAPGYTGNPQDYRPRWVKACNANGCSGQANFP